MEFDFMAPKATTQEEVDAVAQKNTKREIAPAGRYKMRLANIKGRTYVRKTDGSAGELVNIFFNNLEGHYKGAELTLFRIGGDPATTTSKEAVITIGLAAGLSTEEVLALNWSVAKEAKADERGNLPAALGTSVSGPIDIEGLEFIAKVEVEESNGYKKNVIKSLKVAN